MKKILICGMLLGLLSSVCVAQRRANLGGETILGRHGAGVGMAPMGIAPVGVTPAPHATVAPHATTVAPQRPPRPAEAVNSAARTVAPGTIAPKTTTVTPQDPPRPAEVDHAARGITPGEQQ